MYLSAYDSQHLTQACLNVRGWILDAKGANHFFESFASNLKNGLHSANVASRRGPLQREVQSKYNK